MNNLDIIKNVSLLVFSMAASIGLVVLYVKVFFIAKKIKEINKKIEDKQASLDTDEISNIRGFTEADINFDGSKQKHKRKLEQTIKGLQRKKEYLLEEISIYKIFKK